MVSVFMKRMARNTLSAALAVLCREVALSPPPAALSCVRDPPLPASGVQRALRPAHIPVTSAGDLYTGAAWVLVLPSVPVPGHASVAGARYTSYPVHCW